MRRSRCRTPNKCPPPSSQLAMVSILCAGSPSPPSMATLTRVPSSSTSSRKFLRRHLLQRKQRQLHQLQVGLRYGCPSWWVCLPCLPDSVGDLVLDGARLDLQSAVCDGP